MEVRGLADAALLDVADHVAGLERPWREVALLAAACDESPDRLARLPIGERDRLLLAVRVRTFGPRVDCETSCDGCGARLELSFDADELTISAPTMEPIELELTTHGYTLRVRPPDSHDIAACRAPSTDAADRLFERCVEVVEAADDGVTAADLPNDVRTAAIDRLASLDPNAELLLDIACPECGRRSRPGFDPGAIVVAEVAARAARLLGEIDVLARAYGWRECDVLALGSRRRQRYLELALQ